jgi:hypothetical protein
MEVPSSLILASKVLVSLLLQPLQLLLPHLKLPFPEKVVVADLTSS